MIDGKSIIMEMIGFLCMASVTNLGGYVFIYSSDLYRRKTKKIFLIANNVAVLIIWILSLVSKYVWV